MNLVYMGVTLDKDGRMCPLYGDRDCPGDHRYWDGERWVPVSLAGWATPRTKDADGWETSRRKQTRGVHAYLTDQARLAGWSSPCAGDGDLRAEFEAWRATMPDGLGRLEYLRTERWEDGRLQVIFRDAAEGTEWHIREDVMRQDTEEHAPCGGARGAQHRGAIG